MNKLVHNNFFYILLGFSLYEPGVYFLTSNKLLSFLLVGTGLLLIFYHLFFNRYTYPPFTNSMGVVFNLFLIYTIFIIIRPILFQGDSVIEMITSFFDQYYWMAFLIPFVVFLGEININLNTIYKFIIIYVCIGFFLIALNFQEIINPPLDLSSITMYVKYISLINTPKDILFAASLILLTYPFVSSKYKKIGIAAMITGLLLVTVAARRSGVFMFVVMFVFSFYMLVYKSGKIHKSLRLLFLISLIVVLVLIVLMYADSIFSIFFQRLDVDSRSGVEEMFFADFKGKTLDWMFGRGVNGTYYSPGVEDVDNRRSIETGYLFLILKGGIVYLSMYIYILLKAAYTGFFRTNNRLTQGMALYIVAHILFLYPFGVPSFSFEYIILWVCVLYCMSISWRLKTDDEIIIHLLTEK